MAYLDLPDFKIDKTAPEEGIKELLQNVKPSWNSENVVTEEVIGGYSSKMFKCFPKDQPDNAIIIRLQNLMERFKEWKSENEIEVIKYMSTIGHFPQIHAVFSNGYCYEYIVGKPMINLRIKSGKLTEEHLKAIAEELAFIHSVRVPNVDYDNFNYYEYLKQIVKNSEFKNPPKMAPSKEEICTELDIIERFAKSLNTPVVLCHGDPHPGNFVWNDRTKKITFVDWEMTRVGFEFHEVAHFLTIVKMFDQSFLPSSKIEIPDNTEELFIKFYYDERQKYKNLREYTFDDYKLNVEKFKLCMAVGGFIFQLVLPDLMEELLEKPNDDSFYEASLNMYLQTKKVFLGTDRLG